jgi:hypothetical protein
MQLSISQDDLKDYKDRKRYYNMRDVIDSYSQSGKQELLTEFERMQLTGCMSAIPPIMGALTLIGYFEDQDILYWTISYLKGSLGLPQ